MCATTTRLSVEWRNSHVLQMAASHRKLIIELVARYKLPAVYPYRYYAADGGLIAYGPNTHEPLRRAAAYIDRILKGEMPVQAPWRKKATFFTSPRHAIWRVHRAGKRSHHRGHSATRSGWSQRDL